MTRNPGPLLAAVALIGVAAVAYLLLASERDAATTDVERTVEPPSALRSEDRPAPAMDAPATLAQPDLPQAAPPRATEAQGPRVPRTMQSLHGRVSAPAGLAASVRVRVVDGAGVACDWTTPEADGALVLELDRPVSGAQLEFDHPALAGLVQGPYDVEAGVRRGFGLARLVPARTAAGSVSTPDGQPAAGAELWILPATGQLASGVASATADGAGRFELSGVPPRHGGLLALHPTGAFHLASLPPPAEVLTLTLVDAGKALTAIAIDAESAPLADATFQLRVANTVVATRAADDQGQVAFGPLPDLAFDLSAAAPGRDETRLGDLTPRADRTPIPLVLNESQPDPVEEPEDDGRRWSEAGWLGYELTDGEGRPLSGAALELWDRAPGDAERFDLPSRRFEPARVAFTDHRGWAVWQDLDDGPWWLVARANGFLPPVIGPERAREDDPAPPVLALEPAARVRGEVLIDDGRAVMGTAVDLTSSAERGTPVRLRLLTDARGRFTARGLPPGPWTARALAPPGFEHLGTSDSALFELPPADTVELFLTLPSR